MRMLLRISLDARRETLWFQILSSFGFLVFFMFLYVNSVYEQRLEVSKRKALEMNCSWETDQRSKGVKNTVTRYLVGFSLGQFGKGLLEKYVLHFKIFLQSMYLKYNAISVIKHYINFILYTKTKSTWGTNTFFFETDAKAKAALSPQLF